MTKHRTAAVAVAPVLAACVIALSTFTAAQAGAATDADWAWPGMRYDIFKNGSWYSCSVGYPAWDSAGTRYFISAGHCFRDESGNHYLQPGGAGVYIYAPSDHGSAVGFERTYSIPTAGRYDDVSLVEMYPGRKLDGDGWQHIPDTPVSATVGDQACLVGYRQHVADCGLVTGIRVQQNLTGFPWTIDVSTASFCAMGGDSGGAVYNGDGALGIEVSRDSAHNDAGLPGECSSAFIPIGQVLEVLRQEHPSLTV